MLEKGFISPIRESDEIKVCILSRYTDKALISTKVYTQIKYADEEYRPIEEIDLNNNLEIKSFVEHYEDVISKIQVTDETKRILKILDVINASKYLEDENVFLKNKLEFVVDDEKRRDLIMNEISSHEFYVLESNRIAHELFNLPSSNSIILDNVDELLNENISRKLKNKINFLKSINVIRDRGQNTLEIKKINGKPTGKMLLSINNLENTKLKVGRIGRCNAAAIPGYLIRRKNDYIFNEEDDGTEALVFIPIDKYTKMYLINTFQLGYFFLYKDCIVGFTNIKNVEALFN